MLPVQGFDNRLLVNPQDGRIRHRRCRTHATSLPRDSPFAEKITGVQYADGRFFASLGADRELYLACLNEKYRIRLVPLSKYALVLSKGQNSSALANGCEKVIGVEVDLFLDCFNRC